MELIDLSPVDRVIVTDSVPLPRDVPVSSKIVQVSVAKGLARIIESEMRHMSYVNTNADDEDLKLDVDETDYISIYNYDTSTSK